MKAKYKATVTFTLTDSASAVTKAAYGFTPHAAVKKIMRAVYVHMPCSMTLEMKIEEFGEAT